MHTELKEYKPLAIVFFTNGEWERDVLTIPEEKKAEFIKHIESAKLVEIEWVVVNTFHINEIRSTEQLTELEKIYYSCDYKLRKEINKTAQRLGSENFLKRCTRFTEEQSINTLLSRIEKYKDFGKISVRID